MELLLFKLIATPLLLLVAATIAIRRWGEAVGGFLVGLRRLLRALRRHASRALLA